MPSPKVFEVEVKFRAVALIELFAPGCGVRVRVELTPLNLQGWNRSPPGLPGGRVLGCQFVLIEHVDAVQRNKHYLAM